MGNAGEARDLDAARRLRPRGRARRGGDDDTRPLPVERVVLYTAAGCHLCERARATLLAEGIAFGEVDITGDAGLEERYREWLPVVEIDGERAFVYFVQPEALRHKLGAQAG